jgi:hypothetical protein
MADAPTARVNAKFRNTRTGPGGAWAGQRADFLDVGPPADRHLLTGAAMGCIGPVQV